MFVLCLFLLLVCVLYLWKNLAHVAESIGRCRDNNDHVTTSALIVFDALSGRGLSLQRDMSCPGTEDAASSS